MDNDSGEGIQLFMLLITEGKLAIEQYEDATYQEPIGFLNSNANGKNDLPKDATAILKKWLFDHVDVPYPSEDEKTDLMDQTELTLKQINNWFSNARRRTLKKMKFTRPKKRKRSTAV